MVKKSSGAGKVVLIGAGLVAAATAAYFLSNKKSRAAAKSWAIKMKADVIEKIEKAKDLSKESYEQIVDQMSAKYDKLKDTTPEEVSEIVSELKKKWSHLKPKPAKKAAKKASKK